MNLGALFVEIGIKGNPEKLDLFEKKLKAWLDGGVKAQKANEKLWEGFKKSSKQVAIFAGAIAGTYWALDRLTASLAKNNLQLLNLTRRSDIALDTFQKWGTIGKIVGVDNAAQQLENLNQKIFNLRLTGEGAKGFQMAGIMPTNAEDVLEQLRTRIAGMSNTSATYLLEQMGLDPKMITLLRMGREEWKEYLEIQRQYTLNDEQRKEIDRMNRQLEVARIKMEYLKDKVLLALMPTFVRISNALGNIASGIEKVHRWVTKSSSGWATFTRVILGVLGGSIALVTVLKTVPAIITAIVTGIGLLRNGLILLSAHPIIAGLTLLLSTITLIADDIIGYNNGKNSLIGAIINGLEDLKLKGFIDFPVPKWLEMMIKFIDFVSGEATKREYTARLEETVKNLDPDAVKLENGNFAEIAPMSPITESDIRTSNTTNNKTNNTSITMKNEIYTNDTAQAISNMLQPSYLKVQAVGLGS